MKLARALKLKKKLAGEVAQLQRLILTENVEVDQNKSKFDVKQRMEELVEKQKKLADLKTEIAKANSDIWAAIFHMTEIKSHIAFLRSLDTKEGTFSENYRFSEDLTKKTYKPQIDKLEVETRISKLEAEVEKLQEQIDEFNQVHNIQNF